MTQTVQQAVPGKPIIEATHLGKRYGATTALNDVSLSLFPGEVCGLLGENGAGKSTFVKVLSGVVTPDQGEIRVAGESYRPRNILAAQAAGVRVAFQELSLIPTLSVAINLALPRPQLGLGPLISMRAVEQQARTILQAHHIDDIEPSTLVADLPLGLRQRVEIVRAMQHKPRILLLDEPTAALSDREWLFRLIEDFVRDGAAVLYISHKLDEIRRICERCVILRNGQKVQDSRVADLTDNEIFSSMAGRSVVEAYPEAQSHVRASQAPVMDVRHLFAQGVHDVSFEIRSGEILGVAALEGQGQSGLFRALVGLSPLTAGEIRTDGIGRHIRSPRAAKQAGLFLVPEERKTEGIFRDLSTTANVSISEIDDLTHLRLVAQGKERQTVEQVAHTVDLDARYLHQSIESLSGGNQQKAILARALLARPRCMLLFDPTRGVDVGTKHTIYQVIQAYVRSGGAVLFHSTELDELVHLCDRCLVIYENTVVAEVERQDLSQELLLARAAGYRGAALGAGVSPTASAGGAA